MAIVRSRHISQQDLPCYQVVTAVSGGPLCGEYAYAGQGFEHRRQWVIDTLGQRSHLFAIGVCAYALINRHHNLLLRVEPDSAAS